jgi:hypothetical protein
MGCTLSLSLSLYIYSPVVYLACKWAKFEVPLKKLLNFNGPCLILPLCLDQNANTTINIQATNYGLTRGAR